MPDLETDQFYELLTDALRAGPASPQWHDVVTQLRGGGNGADEYQLLVNARQNLESGKSYREIRAGPGFTRKLMQAVDEQPAGGRAVSPANFIAVVAAIVGVIVIGFIGYLLFSGGKNYPAAIDELSGRYFATPLLASPLNGTTPTGWKKIGPLPLEFKNEMRVGTVTQGTGDMAGGIVIETPIRPDQSIALEVKLRTSHTEGGIVPEIFVTDQPDFSGNRATNPNELVWLVQRQPQTKGAPRVVPVVALQGKVVDTDATVRLDDPVSVRILIGPTVAVVETNGKRLWAWAHGLSPDQPRYIGVRLLRHGNAIEKRDTVAIESVRVMK